MVTRVGRAIGAHSASGSFQRASLHGWYVTRARQLFDRRRRTDQVHANERALHADIHLPLATTHAAIAARSISSVVVRRNSRRYFLSSK